MQLLSLAAFLVTAYACTDDPNGVKEKLYWTTCSTTDVIQPTGLTVTDNLGNSNYPVDVSKPIVVTATSQSNSKITYNSVLIDVTIRVWSKFFGCKWITFPTFGLLNNIKQCSNCPLKPGPLTLIASVDLSKYAAIIDAVSSGTPYEIEVRYKNGDSSAHEEIACLLAGVVVKKPSK